MPLIKCPMCDKMISPNAISCPNCGEPMKKKDTIIEEKYSLILEDSSTGYQLERIIKHISEINECDTLKAKSIAYSTPSIIIEDLSSFKAQEIKRSFEILGAKMKVVLTNNAEMIADDIKEMQINNSRDIKNKNVILCPNCKTEKVHKISGLSKAGSAVAFGVLSVGKLTKTYECDDCGYRW